MEQDADYRAWVDGRCVGRCPGGESMEEFAARTCPAFAALVQDALAQKREQLVVVAHGGTPEDSAQVKKLLQKSIPGCRRFYEGVIDGTLGCYVGPGLVGAGIQFLDGDML